MPLPPFERRKLLQKTQRANRAIEEANNRVNSDYFRFEGPPQPPLLVPTHTESGNQPSLTVASNHFSDINNTTLDLDKWLAPGHASVSNVAFSTIFNNKVWPGLMRLENVADSTLTVNTTGPLMVRNVANSTLTVQCHQLRLHNLRNCTVYVRRNCAVVMEECAGIRFGERVQGEGKEGEGQVEKGEREGKANKVEPGPGAKNKASFRACLQVFDFSWPSSADNPNYDFVEGQASEASGG